MTENNYPVGIVTKKDISRLDFSVIRPNEFKCVYENYLERETNFVTSAYNQSRQAVCEFDYFCECILGRVTKKMEHYNTWIKAYGCLPKLLSFAQDKQYDRFKKLHKEEVDDMVIYKKAYDASLVVRSIVDFFDTEKHVAPEDIVCYISHQQQRELKWFVKNQKMLQALLNNYYKSTLYTGE